MAPHTADNEAQIEHWNDVVGPAWVRHQDLLDQQLGTLGQLAMDRAGLTPGARVLDVGCGCGATTLELARRVGAGGRVTGVDVSAVMLERARGRIAEAGHANVELVEADAQTHAFEPAGYDVAFSRFGVMFFSDPAAAFANLRRALRPGGTFAFVCWQAIEKNAWLTVPLAATLSLLPPPTPPPPGAPGPFALADADRLHGLLARAGFDHIEIEACHEPVSPAGGGLDDAAELLLHIGPIAATLRESQADARTRQAVVAAIRDALAKHGTGSGLSLPAASWMVRARQPEGSKG